MSTLNIGPWGHCNPALTAQILVEQNQLAVSQSPLPASLLIGRDQSGWINGEIPPDLLVVRRCVWERIIETTTIPLRGVHKPVEIFLDIDRFEEQAFVTNLVSVFDQNSSGATDAPDPKSGPQESAVRIKVVRPRHRMEAIDRHSILAIKAVIGPKQLIATLSLR